MAKITVEGCIGCGACTAVAPDVFELNDEGLATAINEENIEAAKEAADACPVTAITVED